MSVAAFAHITQQYKLPTLNNTPAIQTVPIDIRLHDSAIDPEDPDDVDDDNDDDIGLSGRTISNKDSFALKPFPTQISRPNYLSIEDITETDRMSWRKSTQSGQYEIFFDIKSTLPGFTGRYVRWARACVSQNNKRVVLRISGELHAQRPTEQRIGAMTHRLRQLAANIMSVPESTVSIHTVIS